MIFLILLTFSRVCDGQVIYDGSSAGHTTFPGDIPVTVTTLDLSNNSLTAVSQADLTAFTLLEVIDLSHNRITTVDVDSLLNTRIEDMNLAHNDLTSIPDFNYNVSPLRFLDVSHNMISSIPSDSINSGQPEEELDVSYNPLDWLAGDLEGLNGVTTLTHLDLSGTNCSE